MWLCLNKQHIPGFRAGQYPEAEQIQFLTQLRPYVRQSGNDWRPPWHLASRKLLDYLLVMIGAGEGVFTVGTDTFEVKTGDLIWIPPDTVHDMRGLSQKMNCVYLHFDLQYDPFRSHWDACIPGGTLDLDAFRSFMHPPVSGIFGHLSGKLELSAGTGIRNQMENICRIHSLKRAKAAFKLSALLAGLLALIEYSLESSRKQKTFHDKKMQEAAEYIFGHSNSDFSIGELACRCNLSSPHFRKLFREFHGISPQTMRQRSRLDKACELLIYSAKSISKIADELHYTSIHAFSRAFKNAMHISPRQYRNGKNG